MSTVGEIKKYLEKFADNTEIEFKHDFKHDFVDGLQLEYFIDSGKIYVTIEYNRDTFRIPKSLKGI